MFPIQRSMLSLKCDVPNKITKVDFCKCYREINRL